MTKLAVVILNYNGIEYLKQFLPGVIKYSKPYQVVVADNASTDNSVGYVKENFPDVEILQLDQNYGFCEGYNRSLKQLESKYFLLLNSDIEVTENWIDPLVSVLESDLKVAAVQPKIKSFYQKEYFEYAGAAGGFIDRFGYPFCRGRILDVLEKDEGQYDDEIDVFWATGACMLIRSQLFLESGGFDKNFFAHMEEIDLCWRLKNMGYRIKYCPKSTVFHVGGGTLPKNNPRKIYFNFRNSLLMLLKNLPSYQVGFVILIRMLLDFPAAIMYLFNSGAKAFFSVFSAHMSFYRMMGSYNKNRVRGIKKPQNMAGYYSGSLIINYYFAGKRKFKNLRF